MQEGWDTEIKVEALKKYTIPSVINIFQKIRWYLFVGVASASVECAILKNQKSGIPGTSYLI
jgi:hypothetical protein